MWAFYSYSGTTTLFAILLFLTMWTFFATTTLFAIVLSLAMFTFFVYSGSLGLLLRLCSITLHCLSRPLPLLGGGLSVDGRSGHGGQWLRHVVLDDFKKIYVECETIKIKSVTQQIAITVRRSIYAVTVRFHQ